jgi:hypothetical protein
MSTYLILESLRLEPEGQFAWLECGKPIEAPSAESAVRQYVQTSKSEGGVFLAIPERSAKTIRVKVETVQKVSVDAGEADG